MKSVSVPFTWPATAGATCPLAMAAIRREGLAGSERSFSYLYLANVLGATSGTLVSAFVLVEIFGFAATLLVTALVNVLLAGAATWWLTEYDPTSRIAFGFVTGLAYDEWGSVSIDELEALRLGPIPRVEFDVLFQPMAFSVVKARAFRV